MKEEFDLEKFVRYCQQSGLSFTQTKEAVKRWGGINEGLSKEEIKERISNNGILAKMHFEQEWFTDKEV